MQRIVRWLGAPEQAWIWVIAAAPLLLFPAQVSHALPVGMALVGLSVLAAGLTRQPAWPRTPFSWPVAILVVASSFGLAISPFPEISLPKFTGVVLGVAALRAALLSRPSTASIWRGVFLFLACGLGTTVVGLVATELGSKVLPSGLTALLPYRMVSLPSLDGPVNPNALGGATLFFLPLVGVLSRHLWRASSVCWPMGHGRRARDGAVSQTFLKVTSVVLLAAFGGTLILSQSRAAWLSLVATVAIAMVVVPSRSRRARLIVAGMGAAAVLVMATMMIQGRGGAFLSALLDHEAVEDGISTLAQRSEIWSRAVIGIEDFPLTGMGLNAFRQVVPLAYPLFLAAPDTDIAHAHNTFLQVALDTGLSGLVAYLSILCLATVMCRQVHERGSDHEQALALGLWSNLLAIHVFGLLDAIALGAKVGLFFWWNLALVGLLHRRVVSEALTFSRRTRPSEAT